MSEHKERPILFSAPMVRAILDGSKTQTRRVVKPVRRYEHNNVCRPDMAADPGAVWWHGQCERVGVLQECPYGKPGDRLWVRETWSIESHGGHAESNGFGRWEYELRYRADDCISAVAFDGHCDADPYWKSYDSQRGEWRPSIHMPRLASRITLEVTGVRVERLQDISRGDAMDEGCPFANMQDGPDPRLWYAETWESINGECSWDANPWVWVIEFRRVQ